MDQGIIFGQTPLDMLDQKKPKEPTSIVHLRIQQRTGKKFITTVEGLPTKNIKKLAKTFRKSFQCSATVKNEEQEHVIQLSGDQRDNISDFLHKYFEEDEISVKKHGY